MIQGVLAVLLTLMGNNNRQMTIDSGRQVIER